MSALPNEDRNDALERMAAALENAKADIEKANKIDCEKAAKPEANVAAPLQVFSRNDTMMHLIAPKLHKMDLISWCIGTRGNLLATFRV